MTSIVLLLFPISAGAPVKVDHGQNRRMLAASDILDGVIGDKISDFQEQFIEGVDVDADFLIETSEATVPASEPMLRRKLSGLGLGEGGLPELPILSDPPKIPTGVFSGFWSSRHHSGDGLEEFSTPATEA